MDQSLTSTGSKFFPLLHAESISKEPQHLKRIKIRALTGPFQNSPFRSFQQFFGGFTGMFWVIVMLHGPHPLQSNFWTDGLTFSSSTLWYNKEFIVDSMTVSWPGPVAAKQPQTMTFHFTAGMRVLWSHAVFGLCQTCLLLLCPNNSTLDSSVQSILF